MKTIALWYDQATGVEEADVKLDLHINFWKLLNSQSKKQEYLLDLGFMVDDIRQVDSLNLYFPFDIDEKNIEDIGAKLHENQRLTSSVFNEDYTTHGGNIEQPKQFNVLDANHHKQFNIYAIDFGKTAEDCSIIKKYDGSIFSINIGSITEKNGCYKYYFRIRLKGDIFPSIFTRKLAPKNRFFNSAFTATEIIDFRINEKRSYNRSLLEEINQKKDFKIKKIHFLLMRNSREDFESSHLKANCRLIETDLWDKYVEKEHILEDIIAYHWSEKAKGDDVINSFNALAKIKYHKSNGWTIFKYVVALAILSICFNLLSSWIDKRLISSDKKDAVPLVEVSMKKNTAVDKEKTIANINEKVIASKEKGAK